MNVKHIDEIRNEVISKLITLLKKFPTCKIALIHDLYGKFKFVLWPEKEQEQILIDAVNEELKGLSPLVATDTIWISNKKVSKLDKKIYDEVWEEGEVHNDEPRLRISERYRTHGGWINPLREPPWEKPTRPNREKPPILVFYSFKGGVGRTTALATFAVQRARTGERVAVIDADLDAPGIGSLLSADTDGTTARWGAADYLLEKNLQEIDFRDYYHVCRRERVTGPGEIMVIPAGRIDSTYPWKLARLDLEPYLDKTRKNLFYQLLEDVRKYLKPDWILIDLRAGLAVPAGILVGGAAHLNVLFGVSSEQSWHGLRLIIERLGAQKLQAGLPQDDLLLVQAMVPRNTDLARNAEEKFSQRALDEFSDYYYANSPSEEFWAIEDIESSEAPHIPVPIYYDEQLTNFRQIDDIIDVLIESPDYKQFNGRILSRFE
jgi:cellulose biosynthesis protein BcsQ